jgi:thymidylate kinase
LIVCVTGPDGSGKSTQVKSLARRLRQAGRSVATSTIWDQLSDPAFDGHRLFERQSDADEYLALLAPTSRMHFLCHAISESMTRALAEHSDVLLLNAYWYKYFATEVAHGGDRSTLRAIAAALPKPDVTFYLRISITETAQRKATFTGYETGLAATRSPEAFASFQPPALAELEALAAELDWTALAGDGAQRDIAERLLEEVTAKLHTSRDRGEVAAGGRR